MHYKLILLLLLAVMGNSAFSQIGGLSGSKLISYTVDVVDNKKIEFEPAFYHFTSSKEWDGASRLQNCYSTPDSMAYTTGMGFRFTYGLWNKMEMGLSVSTDLDAASMGVRYVLFQKQKGALAVMGGLNIPLGNAPANRKIHHAGNTPTTGVGIVGTLDFSPRLSLDANAQYMGYLTKVDGQNTSGYYLSTDIGYYFFDHTLQLIGSAGFFNTHDNTGNHQVLELDPGFTVETGKNFIIVVGFPFDVYGKNSTKNSGFSFALTITLE